MVKRQRTPHFITGLGDGHVGRENNNPQADQRAGLRHSGLKPDTDDIFRVTKHVRRNNNNPNHYRLRPTANERLVRMESMDEGKESRWDIIFSSSSADIGERESSFGNPMRSAEQWKMSAFALVGMVVVLSALFLHLVSDSATTSGSSHHSSHHQGTSKYPRRSIARTKRITSGTTRKKKFDEWSSDEDNDSDADGMSDGQASTSTPNGAPKGSAAKPVLFYPYQPRHRKPSASGQKETSGASYSPSAASAAGFHSRAYYLAVPSYQSPLSSALKARLSTPQLPHQNSPAKAQAQHPAPMHPKNIPASITPVVGTSPARAPRLLATELDQRFVATGLENFQSNPPPSDSPQASAHDEALPDNVATTTTVDIDEESQAQPISVASSVSAIAPSHVSESADVDPSVISRQISYTSTDKNYQAYGRYSWDSTCSSDDNMNPLNDVATNSGNAHSHRYSATSSIGMMSPRRDIDITDLETPRAGLTRRTVDVMVQSGTPQGDLAKKSTLAPQKRQQQSQLDDPFHSLRLPSKQGMGMTPPGPQHEGLDATFASPNQVSSLARFSCHNEAIPLLPKLDPTANVLPSATDSFSSLDANCVLAPQSVQIDALRLEQMEYGSAPHWQVRNPSPSFSAKSEVNPSVAISAKSEVDIPTHSLKCAPPFGCNSELFAAQSISSNVTSEVEEDYTNEVRQSIKHVRPNLTDGTDAASSLQSSIKFKELKLEEVIGGGGFGQVWRAYWRGTPVAVKVLTGSAQAKYVSKAILEEFAAEINLLSGMRHPNICLYMGACVDPPNRAIITELAANGSLWDALRLPLHPPFSASDGFSRHTWPGHLYHPGKHGTPPTSTGVAIPPVAPVGTWPWVLVKRVACGAARGMAYLHSGVPPILHRDLKSANILLNESYTAKVCDFGLSRLKAEERSMTGNCGTVQWMAPEVLANQRYNEKADVFSYGIICTELLTRECPYEGMSAIQCALAVLNRDQRPAIPRYCPPQLRALIKACVKKNPDERPTFGQIMMALDAMP